MDKDYQWLWPVHLRNQPAQLLMSCEELVVVCACMTLSIAENLEPPPGAVDAISSGDPTDTVGMEKYKLIWGLVD